MMPNFRQRLRAVRIKKRDWWPPWTQRDWAPTGAEQDKWIALAEAIAGQEFIRSNGEIDRDTVTARVREEAMGHGVGPLTWLWIASMVIELVKLWREWKRDYK